MSAPHENYYAVLQVQPDAEPEVIEAAYRQLMRKFHPDVAGTDLKLAATLHDRAKAINRAYAVLRDPKQRAIFDQLLTRWAASEPPPGRTSSNSPADANQASVMPGSGGRARTPPLSATHAPGWRGAPSGHPAPLLDVISSFYYFLPGPYEWERERGKELLATLTLTPLGVAGWSLASGRLNWLTGQAPYASIFAWGLLALLALPLWRTLPRLLLACSPAVLLLTGKGDWLLQLVGVPLVLAWIGAGVLGILFSARLCLFAVLPTLVICWCLSNASLGLAAFGSVLAGVDASLFTGQLGVLTIASLLGVLTWLTVMSWGRPSIPAQAQPASGQSASTQPQAAAVESNEPLFRRVSADRVRATQTVPLRTDRVRGTAPSSAVAAQQEADVLFVQGPWVFLQTDDGAEGWTEWNVTC